MGSRAGRPNARPAQWVVVMDSVRAQVPSCMTEAQWLDYLSAVAAECICNTVEATRIVRAGCVKPCDECTQAFCDAAKKRGMCDPEQFKRRASMAPVRKETEGVNE